MLIFSHRFPQRKQISIIVISLIIFCSFLAPASGQTIVKKDSEQPSVEITNPSFCSGVFSIGTVTIKGTAFDSSGINRVEAFAHTLPQNEDDFPFQLATPVSPGDWSEWSIQLEIPDDRPYRILVRAIDNFGNQNWDESMINSERTKLSLAAVEDNSEQSRIAFVEPTFTNGAYNEDSFYFFYSKYQKVPEDQQITSDLNLMTGEIPFETDVTYFEPIIDRVKQFNPNSIVSVIGDEEVNDGLVFKQDGTNAYELLILLHNEYVTQAEYDNLKKFLINGGNIILLTGNVFYGEVLYDNELCTVTLKKGHDWEFDGKSVRKSVSERYFDENSEWFGSNFIVNDMKEKVIFDRNPFNYKHFEENEVTNQKAKILLDYKAKFPKIPSNEKNPLIIGGILNKDKETQYTDAGKKVATFELASGTGKVIQMGIYSQNLAENEEFLAYLEKIILPRAIGEIYRLDTEEKGFDLFWSLADGELSSASLNKESKILTLNIQSNSENSQENYLTVVLPKQLIDSVKSSKMSDFVVSVNGINVPYSQSADDIERGLTIPVSGDAEVKIVGTSVVPEFGLSQVILLTSLCIFLVFSKNISRFRI